MMQRLLVGQFAKGVHHSFYTLSAYDTAINRVFWINVKIFKKIILDLLHLRRTPMDKCIATVSLAGSLPEKLRAIAGAGFDAVEIFHDDLLHFPGTPSDVRRLTDDLGLNVVLLQPLRNGDGVPAGQRAHMLAEAGRMLDEMAALGCRQLLVCSSTEQDALADCEAQCENLQRLAELAQRYDSRISYEALAWGRHVYHYHQAWERVKRVNMANLGLMLDSFHLLSLGDDLGGLGDIAVEKIFFVQLADATPRPCLTQTVDEWSRHHRCFPGEGILNVDVFARAVAKLGYQGIWSLEIFNDNYQRQAPDIIAARGINALNMLEPLIKP